MRVTCTRRVVAIDPDQPMPPGAIVAAVVKASDVTLDRPFLAVRFVHYRLPVLNAAPFDLVPAAPAWASLTIRKNGHAILLGAVSMIVKREVDAA